VQQLFEQGVQFGVDSSRFLEDGSEPPVHLGGDAIHLLLRALESLALAPDVPEQTLVLPHQSEQPLGRTTDADGVRERLCFRGRHRGAMS